MCVAVQALSHPLLCLWPVAPGKESANAAKTLEPSQRRRLLKAKESPVANPNPSQVVRFEPTHLRKGWRKENFQKTEFKCQH